jgi:trimeric autotransporter adhesin
MMVVPVLCLVVFNAACGSGNSNAQLRVMNASPGESSVNVTLNSTTITTGRGYGAATGYTGVGAGSPTIDFVPNGGSTTLISESISLTSGTTYTVLADNYSTDIGLSVFTDDNTAPSVGNLNLRIINASPGLGTADVYVVSPGTNLNTVTPSVTSLSFGGASSYLSLAAGNYEVYFTLTGQKLAYIDSGPQSWGAGEVRTVVGLNGESSGYTSTVLDDLN